MSASIFKIGGANIGARLGSCCSNGCEGSMAALSEGNMLSCSIRRVVGGICLNVVRDLL